MEMLSKVKIVNQQATVIIRTMLRSDNGAAYVEHHPNIKP